MIKKIFPQLNIFYSALKFQKIEIYNTDNLEKLYEAIKETGNSKIRICISEKDKSYLFELQNKRKFGYATLKHLNKEQYIKKISL